MLHYEFEISFVDTSDRLGFEGIGEFNRNNVRMAFSHCLSCLKILVRDRPDVMYVPIARGFWGFLRDLGFLIPARLLGTRVLVHLRAGRFDVIHDAGPMGRLVARIGTACASRGIVLGEAVRDVFGEFIPDDRIRVVPNGIDLGGWDAESWKSQREQSDRFRIGYVANVYEDKGMHVMLEAMPAIRRAVPNVDLTIAGDFVDAAYHERCEAIIAANDLGECVHLVGRIDMPGKKLLFAQSHLAVFVPIKPEGLPWVVLEAMASGLPVIGTAQGTMAEVIIDRSTGIIVPTADADALARAVVEIAATPELRLRLGAAGRKRVEERFEEEQTHRLLADVALELVR